MKDEELDLPIWNVLVANYVELRSSNIEEKDHIGTIAMSKHELNPKGYLFG